MFLPAILMVWPLFSLSQRLPRIGYGMAIFYSFGLMSTAQSGRSAIIRSMRPIGWRRA
jgi:hypothetical protein